MGRLITDVSHPRAASVNDGIDPLLCSLSYVPVDAVCTIWRLGVGTVLAKFDFESAYRQIPCSAPTGPLASGSDVGRSVLC